MKNKMHHQHVSKSSQYILIYGIYRFSCKKKMVQGRSSVLGVGNVIANYHSVK